MLLFAFVLASEHTHTYEPQESVVVWFNTMGPRENLQEVYPILDLYCVGTQKVNHYHETIGEALLGQEFVFSGMDIAFQTNITKTELCQIELDPRRKMYFSYATSFDYVYQSYVDDLPVWSVIGFKNDSSFVYTHRHYVFEFNGNQIISVQMQPLDPVPVEQLDQLKFHYSVDWIPTLAKFETRFDQYLDSDFFHHKVHWLSIAYSVIVILLLSGLVMAVLLRTLKRDFARYEYDEFLLDDHIREEYGWKLLHSDVFRPPALTGLLAALYGTGWQLVGVSVLVITLTIILQLYRERAAILTFAIFLYAACSFFSGWVSARLYSQFKGKRTTLTMLATILLWPGVVSIVGFLVNLVSISYGSSRAIPFTTMLALLCIWLFLVVPLSSVGMILGRRLGPKDGFPTRVNLIPRQIPEREWFQRPFYLILVSGLIQFTTVFVELKFILTSFWSYKIFHLYGFLLVIFLLLLLVTACLSILVTYILLNGEDHRWSWPAFHTGGALSFYVFLYSLYYFSFVSKMHGVFQVIWYFGYTFLLCFTTYCMFGAVGYSCAFYFVRRLFSNVKLD
ncbi:endomembrane protein emp70 [Gorgonomyces haynaldii]|nr:endomembrane protein emp70 [Gorgonomyces haynaldii]